MSKPDFIVLGAPKCGTSSVHKYLLAHPDIFVPPVKERHYFATDLPAKRTVGPEEYYNLFRGAKASDKLVGDVAVAYLYSKEAIKNITREIGIIKVVVLLRNPIEAAHAMHGHLLWTNDEEEVVFQRALELEEKRNEGIALPKNLYQNQKMLLYSKLFKYREQLTRVYKYLPSQNVHIIFQEDMRTDTGEEMKKLFRFLGVEDSVNIEYKKYNTSRRIKYKWLQKLLFDNSSPLKRVARFLVRNNEMKRKLLGLARELNSKKDGQRDPITKEEYSRLVQAYAEDIEYVSWLTKRDLSHWLQFKS